MCKGTVIDGFSTFTTDVNGCVVVIKNVPSFVCEQCGQTSYNDEVAHRLEQLVKNVTGAASAEIAVVNFSEKAA
jgi:YgiT-type zinc finger domain-containing protein